MASQSPIVLTIALICASSALYGMEREGAMNADWFYDESILYAAPNSYLQEKSWEEAETVYKVMLEEDSRRGYDQNMAALNLACAQMAQGKASEHWKAFGKLCGIAPDRLLTEKDLTRLTSEKEGKEEEEESRTVIIRSDQVGIGDIAHFLPVVKKLKETGVKDVRLALRGFMHKPMQGPSKAYGVPLINEKELDEVKGHQTHLVALYGLLKVRPQDLACEEPIYTTQEKALGKIQEAITPHESKKIAIVFLGENRPATLIGGKQLPRDKEAYGRELDAQAFERLLRKNPDMLLLDCNPEESRITFEGEENNLRMSAEFKDRVLALSPEDEPFDSVIALGLIWNKDEERLVGFAADNGPPNLFARTLTKDAQRRFAFIIPNSQEYDVRMEGEGKKYTQMLSHCRVYKCDRPEEQADVIASAYSEITGRGGFAEEALSSETPEEPTRWCTFV